MLNMFEGLLRSLFTPFYLEEKVRKEVAIRSGVNVNQLPKIEFTPLPYIVANTKYGKKIVGKIVGAYDAFRHKIYIDPFYYFFSNLYKRVKLLAHELYHAAENLREKLKMNWKSFDDYLKNYYKDENEIAANRVASDIADKIVDDSFDSFSLYF